MIREAYLLNDGIGDDSEKERESRDILLQSKSNINHVLFAFYVEIDVGPKTWSVLIKFFRQYTI